MKCWLHCVEAFCFQIFYVWHDCNKASRTVEYGRVHKKARGKRTVMGIPHCYRIQAADLWVSTAFTLTLWRKNNAQIQKSKFTYIITNRDRILTASWNSSATSVCRLTIMAVIHTGKSTVYVLCSLRIPWEVTRKRNKRSTTPSRTPRSVSVAQNLVFPSNLSLAAAFSLLYFLRQRETEREDSRSHRVTVIPRYISNFRSVSRFSHFIRTYTISSHRTY